jgi:PII-like signaling protein
MKNTAEYKTLRIHISSTDKYKQQPLYEAIVFEAKRQRMSGATVLKGIMGYGVSSEIHTQNFWELTEKIPLVVEIVDEAQKVDDFIKSILPFFQAIPKGCLISAQKTEVILSKQGKKK